MDFDYKNFLIKLRTEGYHSNLDEDMAQDLADRINNFDLFYEMSDDNRVYTKGKEEEEKIENILSQITDEDKKDIFSNLDMVGKKVINRYFENFF